jgi:lycopene cyclase domain-containing protein
VTYTIAAVLAVAVVLVLDLFVLRTRLVTRRVWWVSYAITLGFQLLLNGILTGRQMVVYAPSAILGWRVAYAPVEDLFFGFAMVLLTVSVWVWLGRTGVQRDPRAGR